MRFHSPSSRFPAMRTLSRRVSSRQCPSAAVWGVVVWNLELWFLFGAMSSVKNRVVVLPSGRSVFWLPHSLFTVFLCRPSTISFHDSTLLLHMRPFALIFRLFTSPPPLPSIIATDFWGFPDGTNQKAVDFKSLWTDRFWVLNPRLEWLVPHILTSALG